MSYPSKLEFGLRAILGFTVTRENQPNSVIPENNPNLTYE